MLKINKEIFLLNNLTLFGYVHLISACTYGVLLIFLPSCKASITNHSRAKYKLKLFEKCIPKEEVCTYYCVWFLIIVYSVVIDLNDGNFR